MRVRVVGKGPVALSFGLLLHRQGFAPADIELDASQEPMPPAFALRTLALSAGSWQLLNRICVPPPGAPIREIDISLQGWPGRTRLNAAEHRLSALGQVVRYPALCHALLQSAVGLGFAPRGSLAAGEDLLTVHAEGDAGDAADERQFSQSAIVCELTVESSSSAIAYERFTADGPLALLPLPEPGRHGLVWCCPPEQASRRVAAPAGAFIDEMNAQLGARLRVRRLDSARLAIPLTRRQRKPSDAHGELWIGNASQTLHPVAGQGFNLGLRDAFVLAHEIGRRDVPASVAELPRRYAKARRADRSRVVGITDLLAQVFTIRPLHPIESIALTALDLHGGARAWLARQMMFGAR